MRYSWSKEINEWLLTISGMKTQDAFDLFLHKYPEIKDVSKRQFFHHYSRLGLTQIKKPREKYLRPLYSEHKTGGYLFIKVAQPNVWIRKTKWVYMETHPEEYEKCIKEDAKYIFLDGDINNYSPDNIERVPLKIFSIFAHLGGTIKGQPELTRLRIAQAKLKHEILNKKEKIGKTFNYNGKRYDKDRVREYHLIYQREHRKQK